MRAGQPELEAWCEEWSRLWCEAVVRKDAGGSGGEAAEVFHTPWAAAIPLMAIGQPRLMASCYHEMAHNAARTSAGVIDVLSVAEPPTLAAALLVLSEAEGTQAPRGNIGPEQFDRLLQRWDEDRDAGRPDAWQRFEAVAMRAIARARDMGLPPARMGTAAAQEIAAPAPLSELTRQTFFRHPATKSYHSAQIGFVLLQHLLHVVGPCFLDVDLPEAISLESRNSLHPRLPCQIVWDHVVVGADADAVRVESPGRFGDVQAVEQ